MSCSDPNEKSDSYNLEWYDSTADISYENDTGITPSTINTLFTEDFFIPYDFPDSHFLTAVLTGDQLEGSDSATVTTSYSLNAVIESPFSSVSILESDSFLMSCNVTNDGRGNI